MSEQFLFSHIFKLQVTLSRASLLCGITKNHESKCSNQLSQNVSTNIVLIFLFLSRRQALQNTNHDHLPPPLLLINVKLHFKVSGGDYTLTYCSVGGNGGEGRIFIMFCCLVQFLVWARMEGSKIVSCPIFLHSNISGI